MHFFNSMLDRLETQGMFYAFMQCANCDGKVIKAFYLFEKQFGTVTILDIILRPVFYLKREVSETGFCLRLQVGPTHLGSMYIASLCLRIQNPVFETPCFK
jgi:hypothetical protein